MPEPTSEEKGLGSAQEAVLCLCIRDGVKTPHTHDLANSITATVVGIRISAKNTAKVGLEPQVVSGLALLAPLVDTEGLNRAGNSDVDTHIEAGEGIVAAVNSFDDLMGGCLAMLFVGECVYVGRETGRGGGIDASDMMVDTCL